MTRISLNENYTRIAKRQALAFDAPAEELERLFRWLGEHSYVVVSVRPQELESMRYVVVALKT